MSKLVLSVASLLVFVQTVGYVGRVEAAVYNVHLTTDNQPDYTDIDSFVESVTAKWKTPQEKCIAIWRWGRRSRRQTSNATDDGRLVWQRRLRHAPALLGRILSANYLRLAVPGGQTEMGGRVVVLRHLSRHLSRCGRLPNTGRRAEIRLAVAARLLSGMWLSGILSTAARLRRRDPAARQHQVDPRVAGA